MVWCGAQSPTASAVTGVIPRRRTLWKNSSIVAAFTSQVLTNASGDFRALLSMSREKRSQQSQIAAPGFRPKITHDPERASLAIDGVMMAAMVDKKGKRLSVRRGDSEGLSIIGNDAYVSFERIARIDHYQVATSGGTELSVHNHEFRGCA